jgi:hypothetical protein
MVKFLFPRFLTDVREYQQAEALWQERWHDLIHGLGEPDLWRTPWLNTRFADGTACRDGNPIFSAVCPSRGLGLRVIQLDPAGKREMHSWTDVFAEGSDEAVKELVISCTLTPTTLRAALDLMRAWVTGKAARSRRTG